MKEEIPEGKESRRGKRGKNREENTTELSSTDNISEKLTTMPR